MVPSSPPNSNPRAVPCSLPLVDMHVHVVGNGSSGSGCWLRVTGWHRPLAAFMLQLIGLPAGALDGDLDRLFVKRLLELVRESSLGAVVILAHDKVYHENGGAMEEFGSFYVPNDHVFHLAGRHLVFLPAVPVVREECFQIRES